MVIYILVYGVFVRYGISVKNAEKWYSTQAMYEIENDNKKKTFTPPW